MRHNVVLFYSFVCCLIQGCMSTRTGAPGKNEIEIAPRLRYECKDLDEAFCPGGVPMRGIKTFYSESYGCPSQLLSIPSDATAVHLEGWYHDFKDQVYEQVTMLHWSMWSVPGPHENCPLRRRGLGEDEVAIGMLDLLTRFPNLEYLTLEMDWLREANSLLQIPLEKLMPLKKLAYLKVSGRGCVVLGVRNVLPRMTSLKSLVIHGDSEWMSLGEDEGLWDVVIVPSFARMQDSALVSLSLEGCLLLEHDNLRNLKHLRRLTPPIYYRIDDIPRTVEDIDTTQSALPLDGYECLRKLPNLRRITVYPQDATDVRRVLEGRDIEIVVVDINEHLGRERRGCVVPVRSNQQSEILGGNEGVNFHVVNGQSGN